MWKYEYYKDFRREQNEIASRWFELQDFEVLSKYPYILKDNKDWGKNIILQNVSQLIKDKKYESKYSGIPFPVHKYIHHGLSSQAMIFNLLGDSYLKKDIKLFSSLFCFPKVEIKSDSEYFFEYSDPDTLNENQPQPTSFDFAIINKTGKNIFVEAKYVETEFGKCSTIENGECDGLNPSLNPNLCYLSHKERNYWELMKKYNLLRPFENSPICPFSIYYQFYRELLFALENDGYYVILFDKRNPAFYKSFKDNQRGLIPILTKLVPQNIRHFIKTIYIQDVVRCLDDLGYSWINLFKRKYGLN